MTRIVLTAVGGDLDGTASLDLGSKGSPGVDDVVVGGEAPPINGAHPDWPEWYAEHMTRTLGGTRYHLTGPSA